MALKFHIRIICISTVFDWRPKKLRTEVCYVWFNCDTVGLFVMRLFCGFYGVLN